jgi:hypothetical protein
VNLATNKSQKEAVCLNYTVYSQSLFANQAVAVIEESDEVQSIKTLGMLLSPFGNLLHTSILYYYRIIRQNI